MRTFELRVLCEGQTEQSFVTRVLAPHLRRWNVYPKPELLTAAGGIVPFSLLRRAVQRGRTDRAHKYVTTMLDLYGIGNYPGAHPEPGLTGLERAMRIEAAMAEQIQDPRFIPYVQVHEFEALMFVDLDQLPIYFADGDAEGAPARLRQAMGSASPEEVDDGPQSSPSKRLIQEIPAYAALKSSAGPIIADRIGLERLRAGCPHFDAWVGRLERLGEG